MWFNEGGRDLGLRLGLGLGLQLQSGFRLAPEFALGFTIRVRLECRYVLVGMVDEAESIENSFEEM